MILDRITLCDFGLYAGQQVIELTPVSQQKPVILLGGLNGGGKTTLLDAVNLVLYGIRAKTSNRNGTSYPDYLKSCISRSAKGGESAWLELRFRHRSEGVDHAYTVIRSWRVTGSTTREELEVRKDGRLDSVLTDSWAEQVEEFLPIGLSRLFLFDGEKIETLADVNHSSEALGTAMASLLGLDVVDQLCLDLSALESKKRVSLKSAGERAEIDALRARVEEHGRRISALAERRAQLETELDTRRTRVAKLEEEFRKQGGDAYLSREGLRAESSGLEQRIQAIEAALAEEAAGPLPLLLVKELLASVSYQADREEQSEQARALVGVLEERDRDLLALVVAKVGKKAAAEFDQHLADDRARRTGETTSDSFLSLSSEAHQLLRTTVVPGIPESQQRSAKLVIQLRELQDSLVQVERKLQAVPDEAAIRRAIEVLEKARVEEQLARSQRDALLKENADAEAACANDSRKLEALRDKAVDADFGREDDARVARYALKSRDTFKKFRTAIVERHLGHIEQLVMQRYKHLLRKQRLIDSVRIDPITFNVELRNADGAEIPRDRLSAGERQLFAVSLLWGLAGAAGRPLPTIVDTPLGRLDGTHREHLVQRYFPHASHQVILLSTDKEIDREYHAKLKPYIGREYLLDYDEASDQTTVREGYFW